MKKIIGLEFSDSTTNLHRCRLSFKVNLTTILCVIAVFIVGLTLGYVIFHRSHSAVSTAAAQSAKIIDDDFSDDPDMVRRQTFVRNMAKDAWNAYVRYAWGYKGLKPESQSYYTDGGYLSNGDFSNGLTIVQSLSTLWMMGLQDEYEHGRSWVESFNVSTVDNNFMLRLAIPRYVGSLLSIFALTNDTMYLDKLWQMDKILQPAFDSPHGIPYNSVKPKRLTASGTSNYLSTSGAHNLELRYLGDLIHGAAPWKTLLGETRKALKQAAMTSSGLYMESIEASTGSWSSNKASIQANARPYFDSLIKAYIMSNGTDLEALQLYKDAINAAEQSGLITRMPKSGLMYARDLNTRNNEYDAYMEFEGCALGAMLALGANAMEDEISNQTLTPMERKREVYQIYRYWHQAEAITQTCHAASNRTKTGLTPSRIYFDGEGKIRTEGQHDDGNITPELAESYFTLYRLTNEERYREYAWELAHAINRYCRTASGGYTNLEDVERSNKHDYQPHDFIGGTLKYLWLTFAERNVCSLDKWVFNGAGQPLPICGRNRAYSQYIC